jgi:hypothetical protein
LISWHLAAPVTLRGSVEYSCSIKEKVSQLTLQ